MNWLDSAPASVTGGGCVCGGWQKSNLKTSASKLASGRTEIAKKLKKKFSRRASQNSWTGLRAQHMNQVWYRHFNFDRAVKGQLLKWLSIVDDETRHYSTRNVSRNMTREDQINRLAGLFTSCGVPGHIRSDSGLEFLAKANRQRLASLCVKHITLNLVAVGRKGTPKRFLSRLWDELLNREEFESVARAGAYANAYREDYNGNRPHCSLGGMPPNEFALRTDSALVAAFPPLPQHSEEKTFTQTALS